MPTAQGSAGPSKLPLPIRHRAPPPNMSTPGRPPAHRSSSHPPQRTNGNGSEPNRQAQQDQAQYTPARNNIFRASAPPTSAARYSIRTPGSQALPDFRASSRHPLQLLAFSAGRSRGAAAGGHAVPTQFTPHGRAAIRALDTRRAAIDQINTPGRNRRRRSARDLRETPRDVLRALSKTLAPKSKLVTTSTSSSSPDDGGGARGRPRSKSRGGRRARAAGLVIPEDTNDVSDDEFPIDRPRFSLPIDEDADSDGDLPRPPRSSGLEDLDDNFTMQSIELPRRATLGQQRLSMMRMSDYGPMEDDDGDVGIDSAFFPRADWADDHDDEDENTGDGGDDATLERLDDEAARWDALGGRISDFGDIDFDLDAGDQSTVVLAPQVQSSPRREGFSSPRNEPFGLEDDDDEGLPPSFDDEPQPLSGEMDVEDDDDGARSLGLGGLDDDDNDGEDEDIDQTGGDGDLVAGSGATAGIAREQAGRLKKPGKKVSRYGIQYPSLPTSVVKRLAQRFAGKTKISPDTLSAIMQASDWFFEQLGDDLGAYANHAKGRTTINESDMLTLMRRYVFILLFTFYTRVSWVLHILYYTHPQL